MSTRVPHSPGPFTAKQLQNGHVSILARCLRPEWVGSMLEGQPQEIARLMLGRGDEQLPDGPRAINAANGQLFAAAPDLLVALEALVREAEASRRVLTDIANGTARADLADFRLRDSYGSPNGDSVARAKALVELLLPVDEERAEHEYQRRLDEQEQAHYRQLEGEEREREERYADSY